MGDHAKVVLISRENEICREVRSALSGGRGRRRVVVLAPAASLDTQALEEGVVHLIHLDESRTTRQMSESVARLLWVGSRRKRSIPVVALLDRYDEALALELFQMGVSDVLCREQHLGMLADVIQALDQRPAVESVRRVAAGKPVVDGSAFENRSWGMPILFSLS